MIETIYSFSETFIKSFRNLVDNLSFEVVGDFTVLEVILGVGIIAFVSLTISKWVIEFIP